MKKCMEKMGLFILILAILAPVNAVSALAAPKAMPDGTVFDAEFYAAAYPDVAAVFGNNEALLYQHYMQNGRAEGRLPYAMNGYLQLYNGIIQLYIRAINERWNPMQALDAKLSYAICESYNNDPMNNVGIALIDVDEDGIPELVMSVNYVRTSGRRSYTSKRLLAVYTLENNVPVLCGSLESAGDGVNYTFACTPAHNSLGALASFYFRYSNYSATPLSSYTLAQVQLADKRLIKEVRADGRIVYSIVLR